jgi:hypothetical protein
VRSEEPPFSEGIIRKELDKERKTLHASLGDLSFSPKVSLALEPAEKDTTTTTGQSGAVVSEEE